MMDLRRLADPLPPEDIEWRAKTVTDRSALMLAYVTNRAIMQRLDEVCGPENWCNRYDTGPDGGVLCGLSIRVGEDWVTKWDGAPNPKGRGSNAEDIAIKGGLSGAMKRAAVQWGIGRYLYRLDATWADLQNGRARGRGIDIAAGKPPKHVGWVQTPRLPAWALPAGRAPEPRTPPHADQSGHGKPDPKHAPDWDAGQNRAFFAKLGEIQRADGGWTVRPNYDVIAAWCESLGKPRPSEMPSEQRQAVLDYLATSKGRDSLIDFVARSAA